MEDIFFENWRSIERTCIVGILAYFSLILMLRISGKRTLSQMKEFDFIVTVALGSTLATVLLNKDITLLDGIAALGLLIVLQYILAACSVRSRTFSKIISSEPRLIFFKGEFIDEALRKERVTEAEVRSILRSLQVSSLNEVEAVVMESNGQFSVLTTAQDVSPRTTMYGVAPQRNRQEKKSQ